MDVVKEKRGKWRIKVMEKTGSLAEKVMTEEVEEEDPREDLGTDGEMNFDSISILLTNICYCYY